MTYLHSTRSKIEQSIVKKYLKIALKAGYKLDVYDGMDTTVSKSSNFDEVFSAMFSTDEDYVFVHKDGQKTGWMRFTYGNSADVLSDYTVNLEAMLEPAHKWVDANYN